MRARAAFTLFQLMVVLTLLGLLFAMLLPLIAKARAEALRARKLNNLKQLAIAVHNYHDVNGAFPPGNDKNDFSAAARLLPYVEEENVYKQLQFEKPITDKVNQDVAARSIKVFLSPQDPLESVKKDLGATNYLFNAGSKPALKDNDGAFWQDSKLRITEITDGTSNTIMIGETLKGDGMEKAVDVRRQHVALKAEALKNLNDDSGVQDWKDNKNIAGDRCASWIDGRFLQGTFTGTRLLNDPRPDVNCAGQGGLSALRSLDDMVAIAMCDASTRFVNAKKIKLDTWKALLTRGGGEVVPFDF
jgi:type II secretory pathway pseudopilin PulG